MYRMHTNEMSWEEAESICKQEGGHLAMEKTQASRDFITFEFLSHSHFWIGVHNKTEENVFEFVDGTPVTKTYWATNKLENWERGGDCVLRGDQWYAANCSMRFPFLCQKGMTH